MSATTLVIIDAQVGVLDQCVAADEVVDRINGLVVNARRRGVPVIWVLDDRVDAGRGSPGWELAQPLQRGVSDAFVQKAWRDAFVDTDLEARLAGNGTRAVLLAGAQSDYCVVTAATQAVARGFDVTLVADAHTTSDFAYGDVVVSARSVVAQTNWLVSTLRYPDAQGAAVLAEDIEW